MSSKIKYLKRYGHKKTAKKAKNQPSHLQVVDDDVDWKCTVSNMSEDLECDDNSDEAPLVAEVKDESKIKWQPVGAVEQTEPTESSSYCLEDHEVSNIHEDLSPHRIPNVNQADNNQHDFSKESRNYKKGSRNEKKCLDANRSSKGNRTCSNDESGEKKMKQEFYEWGKGVVQTNAAANKEQDEAHEMLKPLARYVDDEDLEIMLKERKRDGDPMLMFMKNSKKKKKDYKGKPSFEGTYLPNRYGIRPGYRWDGVDRSNGFEKTWFAKSADSKAFAEESYKWSVEDM